MAGNVVCGCEWTIVYNFRADICWKIVKLADWYKHNLIYMMHCVDLFYLLHSFSGVTFSHVVGGYFWSCVTLPRDFFLTNLVTYQFFPWVVFFISMFKQDFNEWKKMLLMQCLLPLAETLWHHYGRDGVANHRHLDGLLNRLLGQLLFPEEHVSSINKFNPIQSTVCSGVDQRKHQSSTPLAFGRGIHRWPVNETKNSQHLACGRSIPATYGG